MSLLFDPRRSVKSVALLLFAFSSPQRKAHGTLREIRAVVIIKLVPHASGKALSSGRESRHNQREANSPSQPADSGFRKTWPGSSGVERSPEKAGVGGSIPSLATTFSISQLRRPTWLGEQGNLQLRFDFLNVSNHGNLGTVDPNMADGTFGKVTSTLNPYDARKIELGLRISF